MSAPDSMRLRFGVLGTARIARSFLAGVGGSSQVVVEAIASRDAAKAAAFAHEFGVPRHFGAYDALLDDAGIDAVYVPLPNTLHAEWAIAALRRGKHVLCEKPLATDTAQARAMFAAARQTGVHLAEGFPYRAQPQMAALMALIDSGAIGRVQLIQASFGFTLREGDNIRLHAELGGGALLDVGCYPLNLVRLIAGRRPVRVQALAQWTASSVDRTLAATLEFGDGLLAQIAGSFGTSLHRQALIAGTNGVLETTYLNHLPEDRPARFTWRQGTDADARVQTVETPGVNGFRAEAESFAQLVRSGPAHWSGATAQESIDNLLTLEALLASARSGAAVDLA